MVDKVVTIRSSFAPDVTFTKSFFPRYGEKDSQKILYQEAAEILETWEQVTGLAWSKMKWIDIRKKVSDELMAMTVESPLTNRGGITVWWPAK